MLSSDITQIARNVFSSAHFLTRCALLCLFFINTNTALAGNVYIVTSSNSVSNQKAAKLISEQLITLNPKIHFQTISLENLQNETLNTDDLLVTIGSTAAKPFRVSNFDTPVLFSFTAQSSLPSNKGDWAAVVTEQPLERLIATTPPLLKNSFKKQVLLPISPDNIGIIDSAKKIDSSNLRLIEIPTTEKPAKKVDNHLFKSGALIAVKDKHIWSGENARWMLYQAYRNNVPVVGFSKKFLKAGALVAVYSTVEQIATNTAKQIVDWHEQKKLQRKGIIFSNYNIEYNNKIARTLKISVPESKFNVESDK